MTGRTAVQTPVHLQHQITRFAFRTAMASAGPAWLGSILLFTDPPSASDAYGVIAITTLACGMITFLCGIGALPGEDWRSSRPWLLLAFWSVPLFASLGLVDPAGAAPWIF